MKVPTEEFAATVAFYRDTVALPLVDSGDEHAVFAFGEMRRWIDRHDEIDRAEIWLELCTDDTAAAARHLATAQVARRDEVEALPAGFDGFWIANPAGVIHLIDGNGDPG